MATRIQLRRGSTANRTAETQALAELILDTDTQQVWIGDGSTPGGSHVVAGQILGSPADNALLRLDAATGALQSAPGASISDAGLLTVSAATVAGTLSVDTIAEATAAAGVTIDGVLAKDGEIAYNYIGSPTASKTWTVGPFDLQWNFTGAGGSWKYDWKGGASGHLFELRQEIGNVTAGTHLLHVEADDVDAVCIHAQHNDAAGMALLVNSGEVDFSAADAITLGATTVTGTLSVNTIAAASGGTISLDDNTTVNGSLSATDTITSTKAGAGLSAGFGVSSITPSLFLNDTDQAADERLWDVIGSNGQFRIRALNDAVTLATEALAVQRTLSTVTSVSLGASWATFTAGGATLAAGVDLTLNAGDIVTDTTTGTRIGTSATQKLGKWGVTPIVQPASADQASVTLGNTDGEIGGLTISAAYDQAEVQALRDKTEELADDVRNIHTLVEAMRSALVSTGEIKGAA